MAATLGLSPSELALLLAPPLVYTCVYIPFCKYALGGRPRLARLLLSLRLAHNLLLATFSLGMTLLAVAELAHRPSLTPHSLLCSAARPMPAMVRAWYWSKFAEWVDSALLLAQGKPLGSLHYNHHATTATVVASHFVGRSEAILARYDSRTSIFDVPLLLNAAVHTLMYTYYAAPKALRPLRKLITSAQIAQHVAVLFSIVYTSAVYFEGGAAACDISPAANGLSLGLYGLYLVQFLSFYAVTYLKGGSSKSKVA